MHLYEINRKSAVARANGFIFIQRIKVTIKIYSHQRYINICYYLKHRIPIMHRQFFKIISQNKGNVDYFCNIRNNPFHFACQKWFNQLDQKLYVIFYFQF